MRSRLFPERSGWWSHLAVLGAGLVAAVGVWAMPSTPVVPTDAVTPRRCAWVRIREGRRVLDVRRRLYPTRTVRALDPRSRWWPARPTLPERNRWTERLLGGRRDAARIRAEQHRVAVRRAAQTPSDQWQAEKRLWGSVMLAAISDLVFYYTDPSDTATNEERLYGRRTYMWFRSSDTDVGSFLWLCSVLGYPPAGARERAMRLTRRTLAHTKEYS